MTGIIIVGIVLLIIILLIRQNSIDEKKKREEQQRKEEQKRLADIQAKKIADQKKAEAERLKKIEDEKYETVFVVSTSIKADGKHQAYFKRNNNTYISVTSTSALTVNSNLRQLKENTANWNWISAVDFERIIQRDEQQRQNQLRQQAEAEQLRRQAELNRQAEQRRNAELQRQINFKTNWQDFQRVLQQNGVIKLYHFTDRANLPSIKKNGGLYSWWKADELGIEVPMPGGIGFGRDLDRRYGLQNYVRVCFTKQHPMLYIAKREGRIINPVILEIKLEVAFLRETRFSNMNATKNGHQQGLTLGDLERIRFDLVLQPNQFDISDAERHLYQAEILVLEKISLEYITNINNV